jgi:hypothetical protein
MRFVRRPTAADVRRALQLLRALAPPDPGRESARLAPGADGAGDEGLPAEDTPAPSESLSAALLARFDRREPGLGGNA